MNVSEIINNDIMDLKVGVELADDISNDILKDYALNRIDTLQSNTQLYYSVDISSVVDSYVVDLTLFISVSNIINDSESRDYFKGKLSNLMKFYPELKTKRELVNLI